MKKILLGFIIVFALKGSAQSSFQLYGVSPSGGTNNTGVLYSYDPINNINIVKHNFDSINGAYPNYIIQATNGNIYGVAGGGGVNKKGVIFEYDPVASIYTKLHDFDSTNGSGPVGLVQYSGNNKLYGVTFGGGSHNFGIIYEFDILNNLFTKKFDFDSTNTGGSGQAAMLNANNGKLYNMLYYGGLYGFGTLFAYDPIANVFTKLQDLKWATGCSPRANNELIQATDGNIYGMTNAGGIYGYGTIFQYIISTNTYTLKQSFNQNGTNGDNPGGGMVQATNGKLYGTTDEGGTIGDGILFEYNYVTNSLVTVHNYGFWTSTAGINEGSLPTFTPIQGPNNKIYSTTYNGGANNLGVLFEFDPIDSTYTKKLDFNGANGVSGYYKLLVLDTVLTNSIKNVSDKTFFSIYPNPSNGSFVIEANNTKQTMQVYDVNGKLVLSQNINGKTTIDASSLNEGVYTISIISNEGVVNKKLVIIR